MAAVNSQQEYNEVKDTSFPCFRCGLCCIKYQVRMSVTEARRIASTLELSWDEFQGKYLDPEWPGVESLLLIHRDGACVFLDIDTGTRTTTCRIQSFKPSSCLDWSSGANKPECQQGLAKYWGLVVDSSGKIRGSEEQMGRFQSFLEAL